MIWLAWRQFRLRAILAALFLAALTALVIPTGLHEWNNLYPISPGLCRHINGRAHCGDGLGVGPSTLGRYLGPVLVAIPPLLGMFWGAPLVAAEHERGTQRLVWTQSVSRRRWLTVKLILVAGTGVLVAGVATALITWWDAPADMVNLDRLDPSVFSQRGIVVIGYSAFAIALGVAAGASIRRVLPAMVATLVGYAAVWEAFGLWVRPHLLASVTMRGVFADAAQIPGAWIHSRTVAFDPVRPSRARFDVLWQHTCRSVGVSCRPVPAEPRHVLLERIVYEPASHFWPLQGLETCLFLIAAAAIAWLTVLRFAPRTAASDNRSPAQAPSLAVVMPPPVDRAPTATDG